MGRTGANLLLVRVRFWPAGPYKGNDRDGAQCVEDTHIRSKPSEFSLHNLLRMALPRSTTSSGASNAH